MQSKDEQLVCRYRLQHEPNRITMIADCKECEGKGNLNDQACLRGILNALCQEYNVDSVVLSHFTETKYAEDSMNMLMMMVDTVHDMEQLSIREPFKEYFAGEEQLSSSQKSQQQTTCGRCELRPERVFIELKKHFLRDISGFYSEFNRLSKIIHDNKKATCAKCMKATKSDLIYLFNRMEELRAFVIYKGFRIVI